LINLYVLHILAELLLVPSLFSVAALFAVSDTKQEYAPVKRLVQFIMGATGLSLLSYAVARLAGDPESFASVDNLRLFLLPIVLTVVFLPFIYGLAIYSGYEQIFVRAKIWVTDIDLASYTRRQIFRACLFRLSRVNRFASRYAVRLSTVKSESDVSRLIADFQGR
jgi:hypothetical protein